MPEDREFPRGAVVQLGQVFRFISADSAEGSNSPCAAGLEGRNELNAIE